MGNEYYQLHSQSSVREPRPSKPHPNNKSHRGGGAPDPLLRELSALSRAPSLRDPSTSSVWKSTLPSTTKEGARRRERETRGGSSFNKSKHQHQEEVASDEESDEERREDETSLRTGWQDKVVNWIDGGLRDGERKQELLRSISELLTSKMDTPATTTNSNVRNNNNSNTNPNTNTSNNRKESHHRPANTKREHVRKKESTDRKAAGRIAWREEEVSYSYEEDESGKALALTTRHSGDPGYDYDVESESSSSDETDGLVSHSQSPLLGGGGGIHSKERKARRRKAANSSSLGCAHFRLSHPYNNRSLVSKSGPDHLEGSEATHGCGLPWSYWSKNKGKNLLEMAGRSLSCGYADLPRRKLTGQEIVPAPSTSYEHDAIAKRHRSLSQKYRPKTFREMVGQTMLVQALTNAVTRGRVAPLYLFHGPRGTGKTSAAKILAAALNCVSLEDSRPCGVCRECLLLCLGKSADVKEVEFSSQSGGASGGSVMKKLLNDVALPPSGRYKVFIIDECHTLTSEGWNGLLKCLEEPPEYAVFILTTTDAEQLPQLATTRCQKFHFPKIKDADIVSRLEKLATRESVEVETDALELIAGRSNGSLRDAETTLEQLALVGQRITMEVVQELVGMVSNAKLAELLDLALSGDTLNTVKCIREFMDAGIEPLALMSQIATLITDILAGGYMPTSDKGFFQKHTLTKDQLEKLRQALKTLSESEKQIRSSQDQTTWLTATLLQFAPDPHSGFPGSSAGTSGTPSVLAANDTSEKETIEWEPTQTKQSSWDDYEHQQYNSLSGQLHSSQLDSENNNSFQETRPPYPTPHGDRQAFERQQKLADTWIRVLEVSQSSILKQLLWNHARLLSITIEGGRAVAYLEFQNSEHRASAERSKTSISHAFQLVLGFPVEIRLRLSGETDLKGKLDSAGEQNPFSGCTESKAPPSPAKAGQGEFLNSRSFPACGGKVKSDEVSQEDKASWDHVLEEFPSVKSFSSENQSDQDSKICAVHGGRQVFQLQGRRFKLKTVRNFSTDLTADGGRPAPVPEAKNQNQKVTSRQKHGTSLLCWKANKVDEDDEESGLDV